jgi:hypothetical protein
VHFGWYMRDIREIRVYFKGTVHLLLSQAWTLIHMRLLKEIIFRFEWVEFSKKLPTTWLIRFKVDGP